MGAHFDSAVNYIALVFSKKHQFFDIIIRLVPLNPKTLAQAQQKQEPYVWHQSDAKHIPSAFFIILIERFR